MKKKREARKKSNNQPKDGKREKKTAPHERWTTTRKSESGLRNWGFNTSMDNRDLRGSSLVDLTVTPLARLGLSAGHRQAGNGRSELCERQKRYDISGPFSFHPSLWLCDSHELLVAQRYHWIDG